MPRKSPVEKPEILLVPRLETPIQLTKQERGRPKKLPIPPLPQEILDSMTVLEQEHFHYIINSFKQECPDLSDTDLISLNMLGLSYINSLRLEVKQLADGELITMSRQDPRIQMRQWMELLSIRRKDRKPKDEKPKDDYKDFLISLSS